MSLSKLLAAGKSFMGVKDGNSPYRMNARNLLPKFVSAKNPLGTPKTVPTSTQSRVPAAELETVSLFDHAAAKDAAAPVKPAAEAPKPAPQKVEAPKVTPRAPIAAPVSAPAPVTEAKSEPVTARRMTPAPEPVISGKPGTLGRWVRAVNPLTYFGGHKPDPAAGRLRTSRPAVQGEFSLENVKVMRNPLDDSDLEVVPAKPVIVRDPTLRESPLRDTILRGTPVRGTVVPEAAVFSPVEAGGFGAGVLDVGNARVS